MVEKESTWHARIPADIDRPEPLLWNLTALQLLVISPALLASWALFSAFFGRWSLWLLAGAIVLLIGCAWILACGRRDGIGLDHLTLLALRWRTLPHHRQPDEGIPNVGPDGVLDLGSRSALILTCTSIPFHLFSGEEQDQVLAMFAGFLDSLTEPTQIIVRRRWADPTPHIQHLRSQAQHLPPALRRAAHSHTEFLDDLQYHHDLLHHRVLLVLTANGTPAEVGETLKLRAEDTAAQLAALDVTAHLCDGPTAEQLLQDSLPTSTDTDPGEYR